MPVAPPRAERLHVIATDDRSTWDGFVASDPDSTFCHLAAWRDIMTDVLGHECIYLAALDPEGEPRGVLPLVRIRSRLFGHHLISVPFLNYGGPIGSRAAQRLLSRRAVQEASTSNADSLVLRSRHEAAPVAGMTPARHKVTVVLDLPDSSERLWSETFSSKLRSQIRRPQKEGMDVRFGPAEVDAFYDVFSRNMRDLGTPVLPRRLFDRIVTTFADRAVVGAVYSGEQPVAAGFGFVWRDEFEITWASSLREFNRAAPNMLLYWSFMEAMIDRGVRRFNFGRCTPDGGTHRFKRQWGGADIPLPWTRWPEEEATRTSPAPDGSGFGLAVAVWQRLPLAVTNRLGPIVSRRLAAF